MNVVGGRGLIVIVIGWPPVKDGVGKGSNVGTGDVPVKVWGGNGCRTIDVPVIGAPV